MLLVTLQIIIRYLSVSLKLLFDLSLNRLLGNLVGNGCSKSQPIGALDHRHLSIHRLANTFGYLLLLNCEKEYLRIRDAVSQQ